MLTARQHQLVLLIAKYVAANGYAPSFEEMMVSLGLRSKSGVHRLIVGPWRDYVLDEELNDLRGRLARLETDIEQTRADDRSGIRTMSAMATPASRRLAREASGDMAAPSRVVERSDDAA